MTISEREFLGAALVCIVAFGSTQVFANQVDGADENARGRPTLIGRQVARQTEHPLPERFLVIDRGTALLGPNGEEKERLDSTVYAAGAISPDGRWVAFSKPGPKDRSGKERGVVVTQSRMRTGERVTVPEVWGATGSSFLPIWSADSRRILICEQGWNEDRSRGTALRLYDLTSKALTDIKLPEKWLPCDWSRDGKRLLTSLRTDDGTGSRIAWVNFDGTGEPEYITPAREVAYGARLSPDGQRILCMIGPCVPRGEQGRERLFAIDLATRKRTVIDRPGHTSGYCWSSDGLKVAYTWQMPLQHPENAAERKTFLVTCDADGSNRRIVTRRTYKVPANISDPGGVIIFFQVLSWWR